MFRRRPAGWGNVPMITVTTAPRASSREAERRLSDSSLGVQTTGDADEPLAALSSGLSILSDVTRPLRHLSVDQLKAE